MKSLFVNEDWCYLFFDFDWIVLLPAQRLHSCLLAHIQGLADATALQITGPQGTVSIVPERFIIIRAQSQVFVSPRVEILLRMNVWWNVDLEFKVCVTTHLSTLSGSIFVIKGFLY